MDLNDVKYYINRELSWLQFDYRILEEARSKQTPLFERLKFLAISASNLDEFFMVRVASVEDKVLAGVNRKDISGLHPKDELKAILDESHNLVNLQCSTFQRSLVPALNAVKIRFVGIDELDKKQKAYVDDYYYQNVEAVLTPMAVDASRPFPLILNKTLNIAVLLDKQGEEAFATVQVPSVLNRYIALPQDEMGNRCFILLEDMIAAHLQELFDSYPILAYAPYRITRNAGFDLDEDDTENLLYEVEKKLKKRRTGEAIRLEVASNIDERLYRFLKDELDIRKNAVFYINGPLDLTFLFRFYGLDVDESLKFPAFSPMPSPMFDDRNIFAQIREKDLFVHLPYEQFDPVLDFVQSAAGDPDVLAIKQTLYRVSGHSPIIAALAKAADNGKQVTVLVEVKARFDEENNIIWAKKLEKAGCHVIYGLLGLKTHSKITLVVRKEEEGIKRYVHLGTGNYNDSTAKIYTDLGIFTCSDAIGEDASALFNMISGYSEPKHWNRLAIAPYWLRDKFYFLIDREIAHAKAGEPARIVAKMNSLIDKQMIAKLYEASQAGVEISLIVRGICGLRPGIAGLSENITVRSLVGQFLEHSRIYYFFNNGEEEMYLSSADWMPRNLDRRVEILFPVEAKDIQARVKEILEMQLKDTLRASIMHEDGTYSHVDLRGKERFDSQVYFVEQAKNACAKTPESSQAKIFTPMQNNEEE